MAEVMVVVGDNVIIMAVVTEVEGVKEDLVVIVTEVAEVVIHMAVKEEVVIR